MFSWNLLSDLFGPSPSLCFSSALLPAEIMAQYSPKFFSLAVPFLYPSLHTVLFNSWVSSFFFFLKNSIPFIFSLWILEILGKIKKKKKSDLREAFVSPSSSSVVAQNFLTRCCPFDWQILTTPLPLFSLTLSEPRTSPSRKFFVLLMHCCSYWAQFCQRLQHQRQVCTLYVCGVEIWLCAWEGGCTVGMKACVLDHEKPFSLGYHLSSNLASLICVRYLSSSTSFLSSPHPPEEQHDSSSLTTNISFPSRTTCSLSHSKHGHLHVNISLKKDEMLQRSYGLKVDTWVRGMDVSNILFFILPPRFPAATRLSPRDGRRCSDVCRSLSPSSPCHDRGGAAGATGRVGQGQEGGLGIKEVTVQAVKIRCWTWSSN